MDSSLAADSKQDISGLSRRQIVAIASGNALEFYDFVVYAIFAAQIGRTFFPSELPGVSLLASLATFGVGFVTRPLGALIIGRMADRIGRKPAMLLTFALIGVSVGGLALTPGYATIGRAAPLLAIFFRLLQGFALGGEVGPSTALLLESAPAHRRGLYVSFQAMSADGAVLVAGAIGAALSAWLDPSALDRWGWRVALLVGVAIVPFGLAVRHTLAETLNMEASLAGPGPKPATKRVIAFGLMMLAAATVSNYVLVYLGTYATTTLGIVQTSAFASTMLVGLGGVLCDPLSGWLSDRFGRRPVMIIPAAILLLGVLPAFWLIVHHPTPAMLYAFSTILACTLDLSTGTILVAVSEALPRRHRAGGFALIYALAISVFGGSTQFIVAWLIRATGNPLTPAFYMIGALGVGLCAMVAIPETAPSRRGAGSKQDA
jgi:MFS family permease